MLNKALLDREVQDYIRNNINEDIPSLILKGSPFEKISAQELAIQIRGAKIAENKFPVYAETDGVIYPPKLNLEQTSSEITAKYKASLVTGKRAIDLTGGLGIDTYFLSKKFEEFYYCEQNADLAEIAFHNFKKLGAQNIQVENINSLEFLNETEKNFEFIYCDPARRDDHGGKVFKLEDCEPNIPENLNLLFSRSDRIIIKTSPILDITAGLRELKCVKEIHIVAVKNEVKELLWLLEKGYKNDPVINTINFEKKGKQEFSAVFKSEFGSAVFSLPQNYLYEPNAAIMKSGLFKELSLETNTHKLNIHSHLYTSEKLLKFPGRTFEIIDSKEYNPSHLKRLFKNKKANITIRNFSETVEDIRKRFKIKDGGSDYLFFTTDKNERKIVIFCKKVNLS